MATESFQLLMLKTLALPGLLFPLTPYLHPIRANTADSVLKRDPESKHFCPPPPLPPWFSPGALQRHPNSSLFLRLPS